MHFRYLLIVAILQPLWTHAVEVTFESFQTGVPGEHSVILVLQDGSTIVAYHPFEDGLADDETRYMVSRPIDLQIPGLLATESQPLDYIEDIDVFIGDRRVLYSDNTTQPYDYSLATTWVYADPVGWVFPAEGGWFYSFDLGWFLSLDGGLIDDVNIYWFYVVAIDAWVFTSDELYPWAQFSNGSYRILPTEVQSQPGEL